MFWTSCAECKNCKASQERAIYWETKYHELFIKMIERATDHIEAITEGLTRRNEERKAVKA